MVQSGDQLRARLLRLLNKRGRGRLRRNGDGRIGPIFHKLHIENAKAAEALFFAQSILGANDPFALLRRQLQHAGPFAIERGAQEIARDAIVATKEL
ncbi:MAG TPA: hypothetical protein VKB78_14070, partial [Pirellulales bacterium]|nr:hypothetical protein [Pirellulales bacterium]